MEQAHDNTRGEVDGVIDPNQEVPGTSEARREIEGPRIYVASLSDYNAGILHGRWLGADLGAEVLHEGIAEMLAESPTMKRYGEVAEEFAIHDFEGFGPVHLGEYESIERVAQLAAGISEHGDAFAAWWAMESRDDADWGDVQSQFAEQYLGEFSSLEEYAEQVLEDMGFDIEELPGIPEGLRPYVKVDIEAWTRDMSYSGEISTVESPLGVFVFWPD